MRKIFSITLLVFVFFLVEFLLFNYIGEIFKPNLILILIVFTNLVLGIRYSLYTAILGGILKDSFTAVILGVNLLSFVLCAFLITYLKNYIYHKGSSSSRLLLIFLILMINNAIQTCLYSVIGSVNIFQAVWHVWIPEIVITMLVAHAVINFLKKCALKLFV